MEGICRASFRISSPTRPFPYARANLQRDFQLRTLEISLVTLQENLVSGLRVFDAFVCRLSLLEKQVVEVVAGDAKRLEDLLASERKFRGGLLV